MSVCVSGPWCSEIDLLIYHSFLLDLYSGYRRSINSERFHPDKVPDSLDAIVIGSGMSGLSCAALLARLGKRVLVLEQHTVAGGGEFFVLFFFFQLSRICLVSFLCDIIHEFRPSSSNSSSPSCTGTHMFELGSHYKFDSGLHYVVPYSGTLLHALYGGPTPPMRFEKLGEPDGTFDRIVLGNSSIATPPFAIKHGEAHLPDLYRMFPEEKKNIDAFMSISDQVLMRFPLWLLSKLLPMNWQEWFSKTFLATFYKYTSQTAAAVICKLTNNKKLQVFCYYVLYVRGAFV
jgi:all-trans-retinol 13,14-reductase